MSASSRSFRHRSSGGRRISAVLLLTARLEAQHLEVGIALGESPHEHANDPPTPLLETLLARLPSACSGQSRARQTSCRRASARATSTRRWGPPRSPP